MGLNKRPFQPKPLYCAQCVKAHIRTLVTCKLWSVSVLVGDVTGMEERSSEILLCAYDKQLSSAHCSTWTIRLRAPLRHSTGHLAAELRHPSMHFCAPANHMPIHK